MRLIQIGGPEKSYFVMKLGRLQNEKKKKKKDEVVCWHISIAIDNRYCLRFVDYARHFH